MIKGERGREREREGGGGKEGVRSYRSYEGS